MADVELLPLPELPRQVEGYSGDYWEAGQVEEYATDYARACVEANLAQLQAENERLRVALYELRERCAQECERLASSQCNTSIGEVWKLGALACADEIRAMTLAKGGAV